MNMTLTLDKYDQSIIGIDTPDPLRFAFAQKHSAHAGGMSRPLNPSQLVEQF
ncbi:putative heme utilization radical SAM enzyme HutW, partial [Vibrio vulnificus]